MCLILFAYDAHIDYELILLANRDEFYARPTSPLAKWKDKGDVFAGRDLQGNGTWLGMNRSGRIAALTNYRDPNNIKPAAPTRGDLVKHFLTGKATAADYLRSVARKGQAYNGYNLLVGDATGLWYFSNQTDGIQKISPGIYGLSNHLLDTAWPKVVTGKRKLKHKIDTAAALDETELFDLLFNRHTPPDHSLPDTGVGLERERVLGSLFIVSPDYGTRSSSIVLIKKTGEVTFVERTYALNTGEPVIAGTRRIRFSISPSD